MSPSSIPETESAHPAPPAPAESSAAVRAAAEYAARMSSVPADASGPNGLHGRRSRGRGYRWNAASIAVARGADMAFAFLWLGIVNRHLGAAAMGKYYGLVSLIFLVTIIPKLGLDQALVRLTSRRPENAPMYLGVSLVARNVLAVLAISIVALTAIFSHWDRETSWAAVVGCVWIIADLAVDTNCAVYLAFERTHYEALLSLLYNGLTIPFTLLALRRSTSLVAIFGALAAANVVTMIVGWFITTRRFVKPVLRWDPALLKEMLSLTFTIGFSRGTRVLYGRIDTQLLLYLLPGGTAALETARFVAISIYNTAYNLVKRAVPLQAVLSRPLLPIMARAVDHPEQLQTAHKKTFKMLLALSVPACVMIASSSRLAVHFLAGARFREFQPAVPLMAFLAVLLLTTFATSGVRVVMVALEMQRFLLKQAIVMVCINFVLDCVLIPVFARHPVHWLGITWGPWWAPAIASLVAELYISTACMIVVSRRVGCYPSLRDALRIGMAGIFMAVAMRLSAHVWIFLPFLVGPLVYAVALVTIGGVRPKELAMFRRKGGGRRRALEAQGRSAATAANELGVM
jgi:O-antigen/teichoic acid export membrane protein